MKRIAQTFFITMTIIMIYSMSAFAAVDYNVMTNEELDVIIEENNSIIDAKSVKLTSMLTQTYVDAYLCRNCNKIIIDVDSVEEQ